MSALAAGKDLRSPFPWFGGKARVAPLVWQRFGDVRNYVEPFAGSLAVLLGRPAPFEGTETVNDACGFVSNFWRALRADPDAVALYADWPVNENDLHARHTWLLARKEPLRARLEGDPDFFDPKIAGWWVWGICCWIGSGFCSGNGPWQVVEADGVRQLAHLGDAGRGVNRQLAHLGDAGRGVNRQLAHLGNAGQGVNRKRVDALGEYLHGLSDRLRGVRVCSGDWSRVCGPTPTVKQGLTAIFLDPPYGEADGRQPDLYTADSPTVADDCRRWALGQGDDSRMRIALCGYDSFDMPGWRRERWKAKGGYGSRGDGRGRRNAARECVWFSPHCLIPGEVRLAGSDGPLFAAPAGEAAP